MKKELFKILYKYKNFFLAVNLFLLIYEIARFYPPKIIGNIIDKMVEGASYETYIKYYAMLAISVFVYCTARTVYKWTIRVFSGKHEKDIKDIVFAKLLKIDLTSIQNIKNGELMSYVTKYIKDIKAGIYGIIAYGIRQVISLILLIYFMFAINIRLTIIILIPMVITTIVVIILKNKIRIAHLIAQESYTKMSEFVQESTDSIRTTKAFNGESKQIKDFYEKSDEVEEKNINLSIYRALLWSSMAVCFGICYAISIIYGSKLINSDIISIGDFVAFNAFIKELYYPILSIPQLLVRYERMQVAISKLDDFFKLPEENFKETDSLIDGDIEIKNLNFGYMKDKNVLENINVKINKGETLGIIGTIGSGKTTIANLLLRLYEVDNNQIFINGIDINDIDLSVLRNSFCFLNQESFLFSTSIKDNISMYDGNFSTESIINSSKKAALGEDLKEMENGIDTIVGEKGITLSGGQKQRVAIARSFLFSKNYIIFDDSFSALDNKTEKFIINNIRNLLKGKTCIIISNRISDVKNADKIIVLDKGKIIQSGIHNDLLKVDGLYRDFYNQQSSSIETI